MAGGPDSPEARAAREDAATELPPPDDGDPILDPPDRGERYDGLPEVQPLRASGVRVLASDRRNMAAVRRRRQPWQNEAWDYYDEVGEIKYATGRVANLMSKLRLFPAVRPDPKEAPIPVDDPDAKLPAGVADIAQDTLARIKSKQGGQAQVIHDFVLNFEVAAECWLHGFTDPEGDEDWRIRSIDELIAEDGRFVLRLGPNDRAGKPLGPNEFTIRMWQPHPRYSQLADCPMRGVLGESESLLILSRLVRASAKSRLMNGLLLVPEGLRMGSADRTRKVDAAQDDPFLEELLDMMELAIQEEGAASALVPPIVSGKADQLKELRHLPFSRADDSTLDEKIEKRILRIARGLNMPVEMVTGLMATTFANATQIERQEYDAHVEPRCVLLCSAWTDGYFRDALVAAGVDKKVASDIFIWFDPSDMIVVEDTSEQATEAFKDFAISGAARRRYTGYTEEDAPDDRELLLRVLLESAKRMDPYVQGQLLVALGMVENLQLPAPAGGSVPATDAAVPIPEPAAPAAPAALPPGEPAAVPDGQAAPQAAPTGQDQGTTQAGAAGAPAVGTDKVQAAGARRGQRRNLGARLAGIDRELRAKLRAAAEQSMKRALERAGAKVLTAARRGGKAAASAAALPERIPAWQISATLGEPLVTSLCGGAGGVLDGAFDDVAGDFGAWVDVSVAAAIGEVEREVGAALAPEVIAEVAARTQAGAMAAAGWLRDALVQLAESRLFNLNPVAGPGESAAVTPFTIPEALVRNAVAMAGGASPEVHGGAVVDQGHAVGGVATGPAMGVATNAADLEAASYVWDYGSAPRIPFEPHLDLDGLEFSDWDDPALTNMEPFPDGDVFFPGDHSGCICDFHVVYQPKAAGDTTDDSGGGADAGDSEGGDGE